MLFYMRRKVVPANGMQGLELILILLTAAAVLRLTADQGSWCDGYFLRGCWKMCPVPRHKSLSPHNLPSLHLNSPIHLLTQKRPCIFSTPLSDIILIRFLKIAHGRAIFRAEVFAAPLILVNTELMRWGTKWTKLDESRRIPTNPDEKKFSVAPGARNLTNPHEI